MRIVDLKPKVNDGVADSLGAVISTLQNLASLRYSIFFHTLNLTYNRLSLNAIGAPGATVIANSLCNHSSLKILKYVSCNVTLSNCSLSSNQIGDSGAAAMGAAVGKIPCLEFLRSIWALHGTS